MSTSSKLLDKQIDNERVSPKKSINHTTSPQLTPPSGEKNGSSDDESLDREELLKLQIKQIKRENQFLKKKISELLAEMNGEKPIKKKRSVSKGAPQENKDPIEITIGFFFDEINSLVNTLIGLFHVEFTSEEVEQFSSRFPEEMEPPKKYTILRKFNLNRKLQKIMLESEQKRYPLLLEVFTTYYRSKEQCDKYIRNMVDSLTNKTIELSKLVVDRAQKKRSFKGSEVKSQRNFEQQQKSIKIQNLSLPWTFNRVGTASEMGDDPYRRRKELQKFPSR